MVLNIALSLMLPGVFRAMGWSPHAGLALANSIATLLELAVLMALIRRRMDGLEGRRTLIALAKSGLAALAMGATLAGWQVALAGVGGLVVGGGGVLLGVVVYAAVALVLRAEELQAIGGLLRRRID
jgi:putative peptidoglycan lipid II flippase